MFDSVLGHDLLKSYLLQAYENHTLPQTLLFTGPEGIGKKKLATALGAKLLEVPLEKIEGGNHPDFHLLGPEGKGGLYAIDTVRRLIDQEHTAPFLAHRKVFILDSVERMQAASANALLKTLEEPAPDTQFILITSSPQELLPTILSRCVTLKFQPLPHTIITTLLKMRNLKEHVGTLAQGSISRAIELATHPHLDKQKELLFALLRAPLNYLEIADKIAQLETLIDSQEDPLIASQITHHLFALILMWHRDQHARTLNAPEQTLFFPEEPPVQHPLPLLETIEKKVAQALLAHQRNLKFSLCLESVLSP